MGRDTALLREILDNTANRLGAELTNQPLVEADLRATIGNVYIDIADYTNAAVNHHRALTLRKVLLGNDHLDVARSLGNLANVLYQQGKYLEAERMHRQALAMRIKLLGAEHVEVASSLNDLADAVAMRSAEEAEVLGRQTLAMRRRLLGNNHKDV